MRSPWAKPPFVALGIPWANGHIESFGRKMRDEWLDCETLFTLEESQTLTSS